MRLPPDLLEYQPMPSVSKVVLDTDEISIEASPLFLPCGLECDRYSYICKSPEKKGKFNVQKAIQLGVPKGPVFGRLKNGLSVVLPDGTEVRPNQVLGIPEPSKYIIIVCSIDEIETSSNPLEETFPSFRQYVIIVFILVIIFYL